MTHHHHTALDYFGRLLFSVVLILAFVVFGSAMSTMHGSIHQSTAPVACAKEC